MFARRVSEDPQGEASRHLVLHRVVSSTWSQWHQHVRRVAAGLVSEGLEPGQRVAILSRTRVEWVWTDLAILSAGGVTVPVFPSEPAPGLREMILDAGARYVVVEDPVLLGRLLEVRDELPDVERVWAIDVESHDESGDVIRLHDVVGADDPWVSTWQALADLGERHLPERAGELDRRIASVEPDDLATITYTPGTEGRPKGVMLSHGNFTSASAGLCERLDLREDDVQLLYLPLAHAFGRISVVAAMDHGHCLAFARRYRTVIEDARHFEPTYMCSIPRLFEKVQAEVVAEEDASGAFQRAVARWAMDNGEGGPFGGLKRRLVDRLVASRLRQLFGGRLRFAITGASPLPVETGRFFDMRGLPLLEGYGMTETAAVTHLNGLDDNHYGTVGRALPGVEERFGEDGELMLRGPQVSRGYWHRPEETERVLDAEGFLHTGDLAKVDDDGHLTITGRKRDIILLATGKVVAPQPIVSALRSEPLISQVLVHGERRSFLTALITLDRDVLQRFATENGLADLEYEALTRHPAVFELVETAVDRVNASLAPHENIRKFAILDSDLSPESGDLTPTEGVRMRVAAERHKALLDSFYSEQY